MADTETTEVEVTEGLDSLSDVFNDSKESESEVTPVVAAESETEEDKGEDVEAKAETEESKTDGEIDSLAEPPSAEQGQLAALMAERDKRQKLERELEALKSKAEPETVPDPIEDPEGYAEYVESKAVNSDLSTRIKISRSFMLESDPDFARMEGVFMKMVTDDDGKVIDQGLLSQFRSADNPAMFVRDHVRNHERIQQLSDPKYSEKLEAEIRAKVLKEIQDAASKGVSAIEVPDLTTASASGSNTEQPAKPVGLDNMFEGAPL